ncbi:MAG: ACT domain-containing protein [Firmicutes bacterium]|jgi:UPF0237 protein CPE1496|nr:ACT domain-containing protein [Clostridia bacterium]MBS6464794.1 ACT domain-containing protein [Bacillota bacterium]
MKAIITVIGRDKPGIIAEVSGLLAEISVNIEDISQTIMSGNFTMIMSVDLGTSKVALAELSQLMRELSEKIGVAIRVQHEDIFNIMHKI